MFDLNIEIKGGSMAYIDQYGTRRTGELGAYFRKNWGWFLVAGIILMLLGTLSLGAVFLTTIYSVIILGIIIAISGFVQLIEGIQTRKWGGFFLHLLLGLLYITVAFLFIMNPALTGVSLTLLLACFFFASGLFRVVSSIVVRFNQWGWTFFSGLITLILGVLIWQSWPSSSLWVIGTFVGIDLFLYGVSMVIIAISARSVRV